jgi:DNA-binding response OmpR family regulator
MDKRVLVVEDSPNVCEMCVRILARAGFEVESAATGKEALQHLKSAPAFDLVVIDFALPDMSGLELADYVRATSPTVIISGYLSLNDRDNIAQIENCEVLLKPFREQDLVAAAKRTLNL